MNANLEALEALKIDRSFLVIALDELDTRLSDPITLTENVQYEIRQTRERLFSVNRQIERLEHKIAKANQPSFWKSLVQK